MPVRRQVFGSRLHVRPQPGFLFLKRPVLAASVLPQGFPQHSRRRVLSRPCFPHQLAHAALSAVPSPAALLRTVFGHQPNDGGHRHEREHQRTQPHRLVRARPGKRALDPHRGAVADQERQEPPTGAHRHPE